jgi:broad specificity phosphatase PhoE
LLSLLARAIEGNNGLDMPASSDTSQRTTLWEYALVEISRECACDDTVLARANSVCIAPTFRKLGLTPDKAGESFDSMFKDLIGKIENLPCGTKESADFRRMVRHHLELAYDQSDHCPAEIEMLLFFIRHGESLHNANEDAWVNSWKKFGIFAETVAKKVMTPLTDGTTDPLLSIRGKQSAAIRGRVFFQQVLRKLLRGRDCFDFVGVSSLTRTMQTAHVYGSKDPVSDAHMGSGPLLPRTDVKVPHHAAVITGLKELNPMRWTSRDQGKVEHDLANQSGKYRYVIDYGEWHNNRNFQTDSFAIFCQKLSEAIANSSGGHAMARMKRDYVVATLTHLLGLTHEDPRRLVALFGHGMLFKKFFPRDREGDMAGSEANADNAGMYVRSATFEVSQARLNFIDESTLEHLGVTCAAGPDVYLDDSHALFHDNDPQFEESLLNMMWEVAISKARGDKSTRDLQKKLVSAATNRCPGTECFVQSMLTRIGQIVSVIALNMPPSVESTGTSSEDHLNSRPHVKGHGTQDT